MNTAPHRHIGLAEHLVISHDQAPMRTLIVALLLGFSSISSAMALSGAAADSGDSFPFVVEVKYQDELICSGTVLFPRIVVTARPANSTRCSASRNRKVPPRADAW